MKQLQNGFTTPEQSKRLLELGVPVDSADCYYLISYIAPYFFNNDMVFSKYAETHDIIPCWSVGRLIEIYEICTGRVFIRLDVYTVLADVFTSIESLILNKKFDFSKLED